MCPQIIDEIFCPFAIKTVAKSMKGLQMNLKVRTPEFILHGLEVEDIPVKSYHTLFCPIYILDDHLNSAEGTGPTKWEPHSRIVV